MKFFGFFFLKKVLKRSSLNNPYFQVFRKGSQNARFTRDVSIAAERNRNKLKNKSSKSTSPKKRHDKRQKSGKTNGLKKCSAKNGRKKCKKLKKKQKNMHAMKKSSN